MIGARRWVTLRNSLVLAATLLAGCDRAIGAETTQARRPNIVILFADDMGYGDPSSYGHPTILTPNIDRLAAEGQKWTDFYVAAPVCSPSRGALLTGKLPVRSGLYGRQLRVMFPDDPGGIPEDETTLAEFLSSAGYATGIFGKWHLGDRAEALPTRHGFDRWFGVPYSNDMRWTVGLTTTELIAARIAGQMTQYNETLALRRELTFAPKSEYWNIPLMVSTANATGHDDQIIEQPADQTLLTKKYTQEAAEFLAEQAAADTPFFIYLPYSMPHVPLFPSADFSGHSRAGRYGDVIEEIDWSVGRIRAALEAAGVADNTLLLVTSDNGPWLTMRHHGGSAGPLNNGKGTVFEGGMRVPAIFWWPGRIQPGVVHDIGSTLDLYATAAELAGLTLPEGVATDSVSLAATLLEGAAGARATLAYYRGDELQAYRLGQYKAMFVSEGSYGDPPERTVHDTPLLFDLDRDPGERYEISVQMPQIVAQLVMAAEEHRASFTQAAPIFDARLLATATIESE